MTFPLILLGSWAIIGLAGIAAIIAGIRTEKKLFYFIGGIILMLIPISLVLLSLTFFFGNPT